MTAASDAAWDAVTARIVEGRLSSLREFLAEMTRVVDSPHFRRVALMTWPVDGDGPYEVALRVTERRLMRRARRRLATNKYAGRPLLALLQSKRLTSDGGERVVHKVDLGPLDR